MIPITKLHLARVFEQMQRNLINLQNDLRRNATAHKQMALAQSPDLVTLQTFINDGILQYLRRLKWVADHLSDVERKKSLLNYIAAFGIEEKDITDLSVALHSAVVVLSNTKRSTYTEIVEACDVLLASVNAPESLWAE
jgi:hypothetical protein